MKELNQYYTACNNLKDAFMDSLYGDEPEDCYWIADEIGGVLSFADCCVDMDNIVDYFKYKYTPDQFFDWYWDYTDGDKPNINMRNFINNANKLL